MKEKPGMAALRRMRGAPTRSQFNWLELINDGLRIVAKDPDGDIWFCTMYERSGNEGKRRCIRRSMAWQLTVAGWAEFRTIRMPGLFTHQLELTAEGLRCVRVAKGGAA